MLAFTEKNTDLSLKSEIWTNKNDDISSKKCGSTNKNWNVTDKNGQLTNKNRGLSTKNSDSTNNNFGVAIIWGCWPTLYVGSGLRPSGPGEWEVVYPAKMEDSRWKFVGRSRLLNGRSEKWFICLQSRRYEEYGRCRINHIHFVCHYVFLTRTFQNWWPFTGFAMKKREKIKSTGG